MFKKFSNKIYIEKPDGTRKRIFPLRGIRGLRIKFSGINSTVVIKEPLGKLKNSRINCGNDCYVEIGSSVNMNKVSIFAIVDKSTCIIGDKCTFSGNDLLLFNAEPNLKITLGEDCMVAADVTIRTSDAHAIRDINTNEILNFGGDVSIGKHCWITKDVYILKGVTLADNLVIGTGSIVSKDCMVSNSIYAGIPAKLIKENVVWQRETPYKASQMDILNK